MGCLVMYIIVCLFDVYYIFKTKGDIINKLFHISVLVFMIYMGVWHIQWDNLP